MPRKTLLTMNVLSDDYSPVREAGSRYRSRQAYRRTAVKDNTRPTLSQGRRLMWIRSRFPTILTPHPSPTL